LKLDLKNPLSIEDVENQAASQETSESKKVVESPSVKKGLGPDPSKPKAKKKKDLRKEKALAKLRAAGKSESDYLAHRAAKNPVKTLEELTSPHFPPESRHRFEIRLVNAQTSDPQFNESYLESYNVYKKYQMVIHKDSPSKCNIGQFKRFLCNSSLLQEEGEKTFGAFHQQYVVDGRIIAVGVMDVLPHCISSVYLYYDPDYAFLSPGTLTSLFEIAFTRQLQKEKCSALKYYYMGFYIHSCPKMRYKAKYYPSWLLCPKTYDWVPIKTSLLLLDKAKYAVLKQPEVEDGPALPPPMSHSLINLTGVLYGNRAMIFEFYRSLSTVEEAELQEVQEYMSLVGEVLSKRILLYRS